MHSGSHVTPLFTHQIFTSSQAYFQGITSCTSSTLDCTAQFGDIYIEPCTKHYFTVAINDLTTQEIRLPVGVIAQIKPTTAKDIELFQHAATDTATTLSEK